MKDFLFIAVFACCMLSACKNAEDSIAVIWTNRTEFISYCEAFNNAQSRYKITVSYKETPSDALMAASEQPDIVIGPWLRGDETRAKFTKLGGLLYYLNWEILMGHSTSYRSALIYRPLSFPHRKKI